MTIDKRLPVTVIRGNGYLFANVCNGVKQSVRYKQTGINVLRLCINAARCVCVEVRGHLPYTVKAPNTAHLSNLTSVGYNKEETNLKKISI